MDRTDTLASHLFRIPIEGLLVRAAAQQTILEELSSHHQRSFPSLLQTLDRLLPLDLGTPVQSDRIKRSGIEAITNGLLVTRYEELAADLQGALQLPGADTRDQLMRACATHVRTHQELRARLLAPVPPHPSPLEANADSLLAAQLTDTLPEAPDLSSLDAVQSWLSGMAARIVALHVERPAAHARIESWDLPLMDEESDLREIERAPRLGLDRLLVGRDRLDLERGEWVDALEGRAKVLVRVREVDVEHEIMTALAPWLSRVATLLPDPPGLMKSLRADRDLQALRPFHTRLTEDPTDTDFTPLREALAPLPARYPTVPSEAFGTVLEGLHGLHRREARLELADTLRHLMGAIVADATEG